MSDFQSAIKFDSSFIGSALGEQLPKQEQLAASALDRLLSRTCRGSEFCGWFNFPKSRGFALADEIESWIKERQAGPSFDAIVVVGIGGSYLGSRALEAALPRHAKALPIYYLGQHLSGRETERTLAELSHKQPIVNVISKSGTTTEPAAAFRILRHYLNARFGEREANQRIVATTDAAKGALRQLATTQKWPCFVVPDDVGGRFSVLTAVGLLPLALAGYPIREILNGADSEFASIQHQSTTSTALKYAAARNICWQAGKSTELLAYAEPSFYYFVEWWKQLFGESEGKQGKGIFPSSLAYTADLHSLGQYAQDGLRNLFETFLFCRRDISAETVPPMGDNSDGLDFLNSKSLDEINRVAMQATKLAHFDGGLPCLELSVGNWNPQTFGALIAMFETSCAISADLLGVNAFDQPGVEAYKVNLFALMDKPGFAEKAAPLRKRLNL